MSELACSLDVTPYDFFLFLKPKNETIAICNDDINTGEPTNTC